MILGLTVTSQVVFNGLVQGAIYGVLALALVLVYRTSRVINFAVGNMGLVGAGLLVILNVNYGVPYWLALGMALVVGARLRRGHRADRHPPAVPRTARDRARGHDRRRPALARHPEHVSQPGRQGPPVPAGGRGDVDGGRRAGHRTAGHGARGRAAARRRARPGR